MRGSPFKRASPGPLLGVVDVAIVMECVSRHVSWKKNSIVEEVGKVNPTPVKSAPARQGAREG